MPEVVVDFETDVTLGHGLEYWHPDFRVVSASFLVGDECYFSECPVEIRDTIQAMWDDGYTFIVFNLGFEASILTYVYGLKGAYSRCIDVWRLFCYCNLIASDDNSKVKRSTSLVGAAEYFFGVKNFKEVHLQYLIDTGVADDIHDAHKKVAQLPTDRLELYNNDDVIYTKAVYDECIKLLTRWNINWHPDYEAYTNEVEHYSRAYARGIKIDRELLIAGIEELTEKIRKTEAKIRKLPCIAEAEAKLNKPVMLTTRMISRWKKENNVPKTEDLTPEQLNAALEEEKASRWVKFNFQSSMQKRVLFLDVLKFPIVKPTDSGAPCMSKSVMKKYGEVGALFVTYQKLSRQLDEAKKVELLSRYDGRLHAAMRSGSTITGRSSSKTD